jgi:hypothetical protein
LLDGLTGSRQEGADAWVRVCRARPVSSPPCAHLSPSRYNVALRKHCLERRAPATMPGMRVALPRRVCGVARSACEALLSRRWLDQSQLCNAYFATLFYVVYIILMPQCAGRSMTVDLWSVVLYALKPLWVWLWLSLIPAGVPTPIFWDQEWCLVLRAVPTAPVTPAHRSKASWGRDWVSHRGPMSQGLP